MTVVTVLVLVQFELGTTSFAILHCTGQNVMY